MEFETPKQAMAHNAETNHKIRFEQDIRPIHQAGFRDPTFVSIDGKWIWAVHGKEREKRKKAFMDFLNLVAGWWDE